MLDTGDHLSGGSSVMTQACRVGWYLDHQPILLSPHPTHSRCSVEEGKKEIMKREN